MNKRTNRQAEIDALKLQVVAATAEKDRAFKMYMEEMNNRGKAMSNHFELLKANKQLTVIEHIAAGRSSEAILEIMAPMPMMFGVDVRFADDASRIAAENELFASLKKKVSAHLDGLEIQRKDGTE